MESGDLVPHVVLHHRGVLTKCDDAASGDAYLYVEVLARILDVWVMLYIHRMEIGVLESNRDLPHDAV